MDVVERIPIPTDLHTYPNPDLMRSLAAHCVTVGVRTADEWQQRRKWLIEQVGNRREGVIFDEAAEHGCIETKQGDWQILYNHWPPHQPVLWFRQHSAMVEYLLAWS